MLNVNLRGADEQETVTGTFTCTSPCLEVVNIVITYLNTSNYFVLISFAAENDDDFGFSVNIKLFP
jgi:hypothetical protein